jgi:putative transposase
MSQSLVQIYVHIVFSTKNREPFLKDRELRGRLHAYLNGICDNQGSPSFIGSKVTERSRLARRMSMP